MWKNDIQQRAIKLSDEIGTQKACEQLGLVYFTLVNQRINRSWTGRKRQRDNRVIFLWQHRRCLAWHCAVIYINVSYFFYLNKKFCIKWMALSFLRIRWECTVLVLIFFKISAYFFEKSFFYTYTDIKDYFHVKIESFLTNE